MNLLVVGASYRTAEVTLLERLAISSADLSTALPGLLRREHVGEAMVLSTCNRVEVYAAVSAFHGGLGDVVAAFAEWADRPSTELAAHLYVHYDQAAVTHALRVAAGLDSMVIGEAQILGQLREAYEADTTGRLLHELMQQALRVGKRAHAETDIDAAGRTVVTAALDLAAGHLRPAPATEPAAADPGGAAAPLRPLAGRPALVIGAGSMGALALATLARSGAAPLFVANRDGARAARLAASYAARPVDFADVPEVMAGVDVVVTATASLRPVLHRELVGRALAARAAGRSALVICDLAVPRDVDHAIADLDGVVLIDMQRLAAAVSDDGADVATVEELVAAEASAIGTALRDAHIGPTVAALRARADDLVALELARLTRRRTDLTAAQRAEVAQTLHRVVRRLLHLPTVRVRQLAAEPGGETYAAALAELFDLQIPQPRRAEEVPDIGGTAS
jgi:glutamyl-tRNA reductase